jgi:hypothetical protein
VQKAASEQREARCSNAAGFNVFTQKGSRKMEIVKVQRYKVNGLEFPTKQKAIDHVEGLIEKILRDILKNCMPMHHNDQIKLMEGILANRVKLADLLSYTDGTPEDDDDD